MFLGSLIVSGGRASEDRATVSSQVVEVLFLYFLGARTNVFCRAVIRAMITCLRWYFNFKYVLRYCNPALFDFLGLVFFRVGPSFLRVSFRALKWLFFDLFTRLINFFMSTWFQGTRGFVTMCVQGSKEIVISSGFRYLFVASMDRFPFLLVNMYRPSGRVNGIKERAFTLRNRLVFLGDFNLVLRVGRTIYSGSIYLSRFVVNDGNGITNLSDFIGFLLTRVTFNGPNPMEEVMQVLIGRLIMRASYLHVALSAAVTVNRNYGRFFIFLVFFRSRYGP